jgi:hypothetical protein
VLYRAVAQLVFAAVMVPVVATQNCVSADALALAADASSAAEVRATAPTTAIARAADRDPEPRDPRRNRPRMRCIDPGIYSPLRNERSSDCQLADMAAPSAHPPFNPRRASVVSDMQQ